MKLSYRAATGGRIHLQETVTGGTETVTEFICRILHVLSTPPQLTGSDDKKDCLLSANQDLSASQSAVIVPAPTATSKLRTKIKMQS